VELAPELDAGVETQHRRRRLRRARVLFSALGSPAAPS